MIGALSFVLSAAIQPKLPVVTPSRASGIYRAGETAEWRVENAVGAAYRIKDGGYTTIREGRVTTLPIRASKAAPGWLLLEVDAKGADGRAAKFLGGAVFSPREIPPSLPAPSDFWPFWQAKVRELRAIPAQPVLTPKDSGDPGLDYAHIALANIGGAKVRGQLCRPKGSAKLPALLIVQWAGVYPLQRDWVTGRAKEGWLTLNILAHDLPIMEPDAFYRQQSDGPLRNYPSIGCEDRETSTFLRMYLSCVRAADYLASRPDWDGRVMVVTGGSQGGLQAIVTGALHERITGIVANVPAGCDNNGNEFGRAPGWPSWQWMAQGKDLKRVREASRYFDVVNFAPRVKAPALIGIGGIDTVCPPPGIFAAYNSLRGRREAVFMPRADHMRDHSAFYARSAIWMAELKAGRTPASPALAQ